MLGSEWVGFPSRWKQIKSTVRPGRLVAGWLAGWQAGWLGGAFSHRRNRDVTHTETRPIILAQAAEGRTITACPTQAGSGLIQPHNTEAQITAAGLCSGAVRALWSFTALAHKQLSFTAASTKQ